MCARDKQIGTHVERGRLQGIPDRSTGRLKGLTRCVDGVATNMLENRLGRQSVRMGEPVGLDE